LAPSVASHLRDWFVDGQRGIVEAGLASGATMYIAAGGVEFMEIRDVPPEEKDNA